MTTATVGPSPRPRPRARIAWVFPLLAGLVLIGWIAPRIWLAWHDDPQRLWEQAQAAYSSGRFREAEAMLARLARLRPVSVAERLLRAEVARKRGRIDQALAALEDYPPNGAEATLIERTLGMLEFERNRARPAEVALLRAIELDPRLVEARRDLINLYALQSRRRELSAQFRELEATSMLTFDELYLWCLGRRPAFGPAELAAKLERMLGNDPGDRPTRLALAENLRRLGRLAEAEEVLAPLPPADVEARAARARLALDRGQLDAAAALLADGPSDHAELARPRGRLALARGDASAITHYAKALTADPDDRDALFGLGQALRVAGRHEEARPYLQAARDRDRLGWLVENARSLTRREDAKALRAIGDACRSLQRLPEARSWYRLALARDPLDAELQKRLFELKTAITREARGPLLHPPGP